VSPRTALAALVTALAFAVAPAAPARAAEEGPVLHVPPGAQADSIVEAPPSPLLDPYGPPPPDTSRAAKARRALEFVSAGKAFEARKNPSAAIAAYRNAVLLDPAVPDAYHRMGVLFAAVGEDRQARACLITELTHHPGNTPAGRLLGMVLARSGDTTNAVIQLELLTRRDPRDAQSWAVLGYAYGAARRTRQAEDALRRAVRLDPKLAEAHRDLGVLYAATGRYDLARAAYARAEALDRHDPSIPFNLGNLERRRQRIGAALDAYRRAQRADSTFGLGYQAEAQTLVEADRIFDAGQVYRRWLRIRPDDHTARLDAIRLFERLGRRDIAMELARDAVRVEPRASAAHLMYGMALASAGRARESLTELRRASLLAGAPEERQQADALISALRHSAPDSLQALFEADSLANLPKPKTKPALK
jgi:tetratricopeptide (TPR) repeat protein